MNLSSELNQSCEEHRLFGQQELSDNAELGLRYFALVYYIALFPLSLSLTGLIIFLIIRFKHLHQTTFVLTLQVAIIDCLYVLIIFPTAVISTIDGHWSIGLDMCNITGGVFSFTFNLRNWLMFVFVCDRFCTVFMPFRYKRHRRKVILILYSIALAISAINGGLKMIFGCFGVSRIVWICASPVDETCPNYAFCQTHTTLFIALGLIMGSVVPMVMYIILLIKAKRIRNQIMSSGTRENIEQRKRDRKANITFFTLFLSLFGVYIPPLFGFIFINLIFTPLGVRPPEALLLILFLLEQLYSLLPVIDSIAILRNPEMRKATKMLQNKLHKRF
ncbi:alpha-1A adrenergic receptor-like [Halichondria panicea]|uniref:alpha-1A adrenergic receptor-like n=1 Tax=Halichondria panicea TaxID=6063 RepID=UPI00312BA555